jgi:hypothetical protein
MFGDGIAAAAEPVAAEPREALGLLVRWREQQVIGREVR